MFPASQNFHRVSNYKQYKDKLNFSGIDFPLTLKSISKFKKLNDIFVNVYRLNRRKFNYTVVPLYVTTEKLFYNLTGYDTDFIIHAIYTEF